MYGFGETGSKPHQHQVQPVRICADVPRLADLPHQHHVQPGPLVIPTRCSRCGSALPFPGSLTFPTSTTCSPARWSPPPAPGAARPADLPHQHHVQPGPLVTPTSTRCSPAR